MKSIIRTDGKKKINLADFYSNIREGKGYPEFYRNTNILVGEKEYLILETLGRGRNGFVFLAYYQRKLTALKMSYEDQEKEDIFSTVKKNIGDDYRNYFLNPVGKAIKINAFFLGGLKEENKYFFDRSIFVTSWEPADAILSEKLGDSFENKLKWFQQFLKGLSIIHSRNHAHFDIKLENLFLVGDHLKIGDFEFYFKIYDFIQSDIFICGTPGHIAPEMFYDRERITSKIDIFSAGIAFTQFFIGQSFQHKDGLSLTLREEQEMKTLFKHKDAHLFFNHEDFKLNHKIFHFFKNQLHTRLESGPLPTDEETIYHLLLEMIDIDPARRPTARRAIKSFCGGPGGGFFKRSPLAAGGNKRMDLAGLMKTHDKRDLIKYCVVPDLLEKLRDDKIKDKIMGVQFDGDEYDKDFFSFALLETETRIQIFGREVSSRQVKNHKEWNVLVIIDYWNQSFELGLEQEREKKYIDQLLDEKKLDALQQKVFHSQIKVTRKTIKKAWGKIRELRL